MTPGRTRKNSETSEAGISSPFRRTTRASSQDIDVVASPLPKRTRRSLSRLANDSDTDDPSTPITEPKSTRKNRKSILNKIAIDLIEEEVEIQSEDVVKPQSETGSVNLDVSDELELRNRSIIKSPTTSVKNSANNSLTEPHDNNSREEVESLDKTLGEKEPQKIFKSRNQSSSEDKNTSKIEAYDDSELNKEVSPVKKFSNKSQKEELKKSFSDAFKSFAEKSDDALEIEDTIEQLSEKIDVALGKSPSNTPRSICAKNISETSTEDVQKLPVVDVVAPEKTKTPKSSKKVEQTQNTPSLNESIKETSNNSSQSKTPKKLMQTPAKVDVQDEVTKLMEDFDETPKKSQQNGKTPKKTPSKPENVQEDEASNATEDVSIKASADDVSVKTPKSSKKAEKSPKTPLKTTAVNGDRTVLAQQDMEISQVNSSDMEIVSSPLSFSKKVEANVLQNITSKFVSQPEPIPSPPDFQDGDTLSEFIGKVTKRRSLHDPLNPPSSPAKEKLSRSWSQAIVQTVSETIDKLSFKQPKVVKASPSVSPDQRRKSISSDESEDEDEEKNLFVDAEAEVGSDESITESERKYLKENEVPEDGESIGSQDTNELDSDENEDEEDAGSSTLR